MTIREIRNKYLAALTGVYGPGEAAAMADIVLEFYTKQNRSQLFMMQDNVIDSTIEQQLDHALEKLLTHMPVQHITGEAWFYNLKFHVNEHVLIPRPETEELVHEAIDFLKRSPGKKMLDIGTGSGCIPVTIKTNVPNADVSSVDISKEALDLAKQNAGANNALISLINADFLNEANWESFEKYDLIISNPPYIPDNEVLDKNVTLFEPHLALFVPQNDPLLFYKKILAFAETHLNENGTIMLETHELFAKETAALFTEKKYAAVVKKDMQEKERFVIVSRFPKQ